MVLAGASGWCGRRGGGVGRSRGRPEARPTVVGAGCVVLSAVGGIIEGAVDGVEGEGFEGAGEGGKLGLGEHDFDGEVGVLHFAGLVPKAICLAVEMLEAISRDVLCDADAGGIVGFGLGGEGLMHPITDAFDDLTDAGLGDVEFVGDSAGAGGIDNDARVGEEVAGGRG